MFNVLILLKNSARYYVKCMNMLQKKSNGNASYFFGYVEAFIEMLDENRFAFLEK